MRAGKNLLAVTLALAMLSPACGGGEEQPSTRVKPPRDCPRTYELCRALATKDRPHSAAEREEEKGADAGAGALIVRAAGRSADRPFPVRQPSSRASCGDSGLPRTRRANGEASPASSSVSSRLAV